MSGPSAVRLAGAGVAVRARKNLRHDAELKLTQESAKFLRAFQEVDTVCANHCEKIKKRICRHASKKLDVLQEYIDEMQLRCTEAQERLLQTNDACQSLLERASGLRAMRYVCSFAIRRNEPELYHRHSVTEKQFAVDCFLAHFTLTTEESEALQSRDMRIDTQFLQIMCKAEAIREDCRVLMTGEDGPSHIGYVISFLIFTIVKKYI